MTFSPTPLGEALVGGYRDMGLSNLWTPDLRARIEANITLVAQGRRSKARAEPCPELQRRGDSSHMRRRPDCVLLGTSLTPGKLSAQQRTCWPVLLQVSLILK
jgi:hypothetical protein